MVFTSLLFVFGFLPIVFLLYSFLPWKNIVLVIFSLLFYSWGNLPSLVILILSIAWNYISGLELEEYEDQKTRKIILWITVVFNLGILTLYKYSGNLLNDLVVPLGLSFFTFSSLSYIFDVYYGTSKACRNVIDFSLYVSFFGKVSMGPIVSYHDFENQMHHRSLKKSNVFPGFLMFITGLIKKVLIADQLSSVFTLLATNHSVLGSWLYAICYMLQIYFDFSGYSDMAIGLSRFFGFDFKANFDHPYTAINVQDFWRRWHISLSTWFRDYLYIPLGGNRTNYIRNIFIVWFCTGLWHGANLTFIVWGLYYGCFLLLEKYFLREKLEQLPKFIGHIYTLLVVLIGWVFFMSPNLGAAFSVIGHMFGIGASGFVDQSCLFILSSYFILFILGIFFSGNWFDRWMVQFYEKSNSSVLVFSLVYIFMFVLCVCFMVSSTYHSFLYFAF